MLVSYYYSTASYLGSRYFTLPPTNLLQMVFYSPVSFYKHTSSTLYFTVPGRDEARATRGILQSDVTPTCALTAIFYDLMSCQHTFYVRYLMSYIFSKHASSVEDVHMILSTKVSNKNSLMNVSRSEV